MSAERTEGGERVCAVAAGRRRVLGIASRFNRPQSASPARFRARRGTTAPPGRGSGSGRACLCGRCRSSPRARNRKSVQPASVGFAREVPSSSRNDSSPWGGAGQGERVCAFVAGRRLALGRTDRFNRPQSASPARFRARRGTTAPPGGERVDLRGRCGPVTSRRDPRWRGVLSAAWSRRWLRLWWPRSCPRRHRVGPSGDRRRTAARLRGTRAVRPR